MANIWIDAAGLWYDDQTGNTFDPDEGFWRSKDRRAMLDANGSWVPAVGSMSGRSANWNPASFGVTGTPPGDTRPIQQQAPGSYNPNAGRTVTGGGGSTSNTNLNYNLGQDKQIADEQNALNKYIADADNRTRLEVQRLANESQERLAALDRDLQLQLETKRITSAEYMQQRELAQQQEQFVKDLALRTLIADRDYEIAQATQRLNELSEIRAERELQSKLASSPEDFVQYEFYKRALGSPQAWTVANQAVNAQSQVGANGMSTQPGVGPNGEETLIEGGYPDAPPAYSDQALQQVAAGLFNQAGESQYNPRLSGTGVFGSQIQSPNSISRLAGLNMTDQEMGILSSFLKGGIDMGGGRRVSIDPNEYFQQVEQSWTPTLSSIGAATSYR